MSNNDAWQELTSRQPASGQGAPQPRRRAAQQEHRRRRKRRSVIVLGALLAVLVGVSVVAWPVVSDIVRSFSAPAAEDYTAEDATGETVRVTIPEGATGAEIATVLQENDVVASRAAFLEVANASPEASRIQPGAYELATRVPAADALAALLDPATRKQIVITIPEGFTITQVVERVAAATEQDVEAVRAVAQDPTALGLPAEAGGQAEGWFAPATYTFEEGDGVDAILRTMVAQTSNRLESLGVPKDRWEEALIKASIIEREVAMPEYYGKVARVLDNRLEGASETVGRLQMDSTVLYGVGKSGGIPTREDLENQNPYNSYLNAGLPPTPIGSPGEPAITAAMNPEPGDWLYFVTVNLDTGETKFASTLAEHNAYVQELRDWRANNG